VEQIEKHMQYPDDYSEAKMGVCVDEVNVQLKDDVDAHGASRDIALIQISMAATFDVRPNSYLSSLTVRDVDVCLGNRQNLQQQSLLEALETAVTVQIDVETDSVHLGRNRVKVHSVGPLELRLNPHLLQANARKLQGLAHTLKDIVDRNVQRLKELEAKRSAEEKEKEGGDVEMKEVAEAVAIEENEGDDGDAVISSGDVLAVKSRRFDDLRFVSFQSVHRQCDAPHTAVLGCWVSMESEAADDGAFVFVRDAKRTKEAEYAMIKLGNVLRDEEGAYRVLRTTKSGRGDTANWTLDEESKRRFIDELRRHEQQMILNAEAAEACEEVE